MKSKLKFNQIKIIRNDNYLQWAVISYYAPFQVRSTKTFKHYKSNPFNDVKKLFLFSENFVSNRKRCFMQC